MLYDPQWEQKQKTESWRVALLKAADLIDEHGHAKRVFIDRKGRMCVVGAISMAVYGDPLRYGSESGEACEWFKLAIGQQGICDWNNHKERTKEEVVAKLRKVALE